MKTIHDFEGMNPMHEAVSLRRYEGQVVLIVNTATECGLADQFDALEKIHERFKDRGLAVLGFPSNQFNNQEPVEDKDMTAVCKLNHGVTFPLFAKVDVKGAGIHPLFDYLTNTKKGLLGSAIKWNFTKFLVDKDGQVVKRYAPTTKPEAIIPDIEKLLESESSTAAN